MSKFQEYIPIYEGDRFCLMCSQACPVRRVTKSEATSPHGWALLVSSVGRGLLPWDAQSVDVLYQCSDCGNCQGNCATDRPLPYAIQAARAEVVRLGAAPPSAVELDKKLQEWGNPYREFSTNTRAKNGPHDSSSALASSVLFIGDAAAIFTPDLIDAAEKLLSAIGVSWLRMGEGQSSGYLPYTLGLWETARSMATRVVEAVEQSGATHIITLSPQDAHTILHDYAEIGVPLPEGVNVSTLVDVLANAGDKLQIAPRSAVPYTWHDATQSHRLKHHTMNARVLAATVMGTEPTEMLFREHLATPLSSGGLVFTQPGLAEKLARTRIAEVRETGTELVLTDDPLDTVILEKYADGIRVLNLYHVLAQQLQ